MASNPELVQYIADQCSSAGDTTVKKMFDDYGIYCNGKIFGLICDDTLFIKITEAGKKLMPNMETDYPYERGKFHFVVSEVDDSKTLSAFVLATCEELPVPKPKKKRVK